jgi:hypothetical protein
MNISSMYHLYEIHSSLCWRWCRSLKKRHQPTLAMLGINEEN